MREGMKEDIYRFLIIGLVSLLIFLSFKIIQPFFIIFITSFFLAYLTRPLFLRINKIFPKATSSFISLIIVLLLIFIPLSFITLNILNEARTYITVGNVEEFKQFFYEKAGFLQESLGLNLAEMVSQITTYTYNFLTSSLSKIPSFLLVLFLISFSYYYLLYDWERVTSWFEKFLPFNNKNRKIEHLKKSTESIMKGSLFIAFLEAVVGFIGFSLLGVKLSFVLAFLLFFFAFIPGVGPSLIWVPLTIYFFLIGDYFSAAGMLVLGFVLSYFLDTIFRTKFLGDKTKIHPLIMLFGILGGIAVFGIFGFIIGPLVLVFTIDLIEEIIGD